MPIEATPEKNAVMFVWFNHYSGILIKTPTQTLVIDPVDVKARNLNDVNAILITHEHYDHLDPRLIQKMQAATNCTIIADPTSTKRLSPNIPPEKLMEIHPGKEIKIGEVTIKAEKSNHPATTPISYIITSEDGVKIFHTADSLPYPELAELGKKEKFDLVFCTVGIAPHATPETGAEIAKLTKPQVAVPYHTNTTASQKEFAEILKKELPRTACLIPEPNNIYQISKRK